MNNTSEHGGCSNVPIVVYYEFRRAQVHMWLKSFRFEPRNGLMNKNDEHNLLTELIIMNNKIKFI